MTIGPFGVQPTGFVAKTLSDVQTDLIAAFQAAFGVSINTSPSTLFGQYIGIMSERQSDLWDLAQDVYNCGDPDGAAGAALDNLCSITGTLRQGASSSTVVLTLTGTPLTVVPAGRQAKNDAGTLFATNASATISAASAFTGAGITYNIFDRITAGNVIYQCTVGGVSGVTAPTGTGTGITTRGTEVWESIGSGTGYIDIAATCSVTGPFPAPSGSILTISTPVAGWSSVWNSFDAIVGANVEQDPALRVRRLAELYTEANATIGAIRERVLKVGAGTPNPVTACNVVQNSTMFPDANGIPAKAVDVLVNGGLDADIAAALFGVVSAGIQTFGSTTVTVTDPLGNTQSVAFSRPNNKLVYLVINAEVDGNLFDAINGPSQIQTNVLTWALGYYTLGKGVAANAILSQVFRQLGVINVTSILLGLAPNPVSSGTLPATWRDLHVFDSSRTIVNIVNGSESAP